MSNTDIPHTYSCPFCHRPFEYKGAGDELYFPCPHCQCEIAIENVDPVEKPVPRPPQARKVTEQKKNDVPCRGVKYTSCSKEKQPKRPEEEKNIRYAVCGCILFVLWIVLFFAVGMYNLTAGYCVLALPLVPVVISLFVAAAGILFQNKEKTIGILKILRVIFFAFSWIIIFFCAWTKPKK